MKRGYREVPHVADVALEVWGRDLPELFEHAAEGLFSLAVTVEPGASISAERQIDLSAMDLETLLVGWLNELLLLYDEHGEGFVDFDVALPAPGELSAKVHATKDYAGLKAIKAATFHSLAIRQEPGGYRAVVVFDV
jgi:SHS2 domain-containing protein